ncbi:hypothetical protein BJ138DRAFT_1154627 [Hygrophoropsis aurantiaca]|uniref:Uncharacterized protein n=1 Tax=Hygrophoropsis aurantiaca TaxID=72124 RepID=A0ACB8A914_9AGAM|nr:hypothetical protein BJ138DRAFT_1154627 [Hygrophoropsis aurantiaca]
MPDTMNDVQDRLWDIETHLPEFKRGCKGLLYATRCDGPLIVDVPLIEGARELKTIEDLYVECWVRQRGHKDTSARRSKLRKTYYNVPNLEHVPIDYAYTFLTEEGETDPPINSLVNTLSPPMPKAPHHMGNLLVIKHERDSNLAILDVCDKDIDMSTLILRSAIQHGVMPQTRQRKTV